jgi:hypothetical protein
MAFVEDSLAGSFNSTSNVTIAIGDASGTKLVKNVVIHNIDTVSHTVIIEFVKNSTAYRMFSVFLASGDTLVQDFILALKDANYTLRARLAETATTTQPAFVATLAQVS